METAICRSVKTNGRRCKSPSLGLSAFCYFHSRLYRRHKNLLENSPVLLENDSNPVSSATGQPQYLPNPLDLDLPPLEDVESIQVSISLLIAALARNRIDSKRAAVLLYGLQLASTNARSITIEPAASSIVRRPLPHQIRNRPRSRRLTRPQHQELTTKGATHDQHVQAVKLEASPPVAPGGP
jgi:hypothetical protein